MLHQMVSHCRECSSKLFYDVQCVELICVLSKKTGNIMHTHTRAEGAGIGYAIRQLPTFVGLSPNVKCFTIYQLGYTFDLSETRLPLPHNRLLLTTS